MSELAKNSCEPCRGGVPPLEAAEIDALLPEVKECSAVDAHHIEREYSFPDFAQALAFVNDVGAIAETENHHPDIWFTWGKVKIEIRTHKIDGLTRSDFVLAAKIDQIS